MVAIFCTHWAERCCMNKMNKSYLKLKVECLAGEWEVEKEAGQERGYGGCKEGRKKSQFGKEDIGLN